MDMESMARLMQVLMSSGGGDSDSDTDSAPDSPPPNSNTADNADTADDSGDFDFSGMFDNINFDMLSKMGELFSQFNKPDMNSTLLMALKPHLREENQHKVDSAVKMSRMISMLPMLKDSGILNDLF